MSDVLSRVKANYRESLGAAKRVIEVPEWGDENGPLEIFVAPANLYMRDQIWTLYAENKIHEASVEVIILRARTADGIPIFTKGAKETLMKQGNPDVVIRVAGEITSDIEFDEEEAFKEAGK